ncbi:MAG: VWA domain-containing protein [Acidobacteriota bacterium]|nr:VWA domain-containing protein [Acidobacteriota bacterium]
MIRLHDPWALALLLALLPLFWLWWRQSRRPPALLHADLAPLEGAPGSWRIRLRHLPRVLRVLFLVLAAVALARPQYGVRNEEVTTHGVDIVIVLDRSGSMRALDLSPDRLTVARRTIRHFVLGRPTDRLGLIPFAREAYTACPLTLDHQALLALLEAVDFATPDEDGTAIGLGLAAGIARLQASDARSRVIILVTDGVNNAGAIAPMTAAELARKKGLRIYTIGIGTHGVARLPVQGPSGRWRVIPVPVEIDEQTLTRIAETTGGRYFRADEDGKLEQIFEIIDGLEKSEIRSRIHVAWSDRFEPWLLAAGLLLLLEIFCARFVFGRLP